MNAAQVGMADVIEQNAIADVESARRRALEQARMIQAQMARLVAEMESDSTDAQPSAAMGALDRGVALDRYLHD